jgi:hypothetical protein
MDIAGLGGDAQFGAVEAHAWYFIPIFDGRQGCSEAGGQCRPHPVASAMTFRCRTFTSRVLTTFRGFARSGIGPMQVGNDGALDSIGGTDLRHRYNRVELPRSAFLKSGALKALSSRDFGTVFGTDAVTVANGSGTCT